MKTDKFNHSGKNNSSGNSRGRASNILRRYIAENHGNRGSYGNYGFPTHVNRHSNSNGSYNNNSSGNSNNHSSYIYIDDGDYDYSYGNSIPSTNRANNSLQWDGYVSSTSINSLKNGRSTIPDRRNFEQNNNSNNHNYSNNPTLPQNSLTNGPSSAPVFYPNTSMASSVAGVQKTAAINGQQFRRSSKFVATPSIRTTSAKSTHTIPSNLTLANSRASPAQIFIREELPVAPSNLDPRKITAKRPLSTEWNLGTKKQYAFDKPANKSKLFENEKEKSIDGFWTKNSIKLKEKQSTVNGFNSNNSYIVRSNIRSKKYKRDYNEEVIVISDIDEDDAVLLDSWKSVISDQSACETRNPETQKLAVQITSISTSLKSQSNTISGIFSNLPTLSETSNPKNYIPDQMVSAAVDDRNSASIIAFNNLKKFDAAATSNSRQSNFSAKSDSLVAVNLTLPVITQNKEHGNIYVEKIQKAPGPTLKWVCEEEERILHMIMLEKIMPNVKTLENLNDRDEIIAHTTPLLYNFLYQKPLPHESSRKAICWGPLAGPRSTIVGDDGEINKASVWMMSSGDYGSLVGKADVKMYRPLSRDNAASTVAVAAAGAKNRYSLNSSVGF
ncbi:hypothetical protein HK100_000771, partial [Physocladia obscura]